MSSKFKNMSIIASFFSLWIASFLNANLEVIFGFLLILSFGMLHGANDLMLFEKLTESKRNIPFTLMLALYILVVLTVLMLFYLLPVLALILFVLGSAYHFGEQHWEHENIKSAFLIKYLFYFSYGLFVIALLLLLNSSEVVTIIESIINDQFSSITINYLFYIVAICLASLTFFISITDLDFRKSIWQELLYLLVFAIIFQVSSLIWGFAIYFIFWHSLPSLYDQIRFMYNGFDRSKIFTYVKKSLPYWLISILGLVIIYFIFKDMTIFNGLFFSFLAAVTLPHSFLISKMFRQVKKK